MNIKIYLGILGGTFVPCQAWTTAFFDTTIVGRANALVGGWGNSGGGFTFIIMVALYDKLRQGGVSSHSAWRGMSLPGFAPFSCKALDAL
jgi:MFS transporter, NNP family, nitrate/nitrite transporter